MLQRLYAVEMLTVIEASYKKYLDARSIQSVEVVRV